MVNNANDVEDNPYESPFYNKMMDKLMLTNSVTINEVEEPNSPTHLEVMRDLLGIMMDFEQTMSPSTPRSKTNSIYDD
jgi:hypothetical protein